MRSFTFFNALFVCFFAFHFFDPSSPTPRHHHHHHHPPPASQSLASDTEAAVGALRACDTFAVQRLLRATMAESQQLQRHCVDAARRRSLLGDGLRPLLEAAHVPRSLLRAVDEYDRAAAAAHDEHAHLWRSFNMSTAPLLDAVAASEAALIRRREECQQSGGHGGGGAMGVDGDADADSVESNGYGRDGLYAESDQTVAFGEEGVELARATRAHQVLALTSARQIASFAAGAKLISRQFGGGSAKDASLEAASKANASASADADADAEVVKAAAGVAGPTAMAEAARLLDRVEARLTALRMRQDGPGHGADSGSEGDAAADGDDEDDDMYAGLRPGLAQALRLLLEGRLLPIGADGLVVSDASAAASSSSSSSTAAAGSSSSDSTASRIDGERDAALAALHVALHTDNDLGDTDDDADDGSLTPRSRRMRALQRTVLQRERRAQMAAAEAMARDAERAQQMEALRQRVAAIEAASKRMAERHAAQTDDMRRALQRNEQALNELIGGDDDADADGGDASDNEQLLLGLLQSAFASDAEAGRRLAALLADPAFAQRTAAQKCDALRAIVRAQQRASAAALLAASASASAASGAAGAQNAAATTILLDSDLEDPASLVRRLYAASRANGGTADGSAGSDDGTGSAGHGGPMDADSVRRFNAAAAAALGQCEAVRLAEHEIMLRAQGVDAAGRQRALREKLRADHKRARDALREQQEQLQLQQVSASGSLVPNADAAIGAGGSDNNANANATAAEIADLIMSAQDGDGPGGGAALARLQMRARHAAEQEQVCLMCHELSECVDESGCDGWGEYSFMR